MFMKELLNFDKLNYKSIFRIRLKIKISNEIFRKTETRRRLSADRHPSDSDISSKLVLFFL